MPCDAAELRSRASRVKLLLFDVDGVLTDGSIIVHADGSESKRFHIRDGAAIVWANRAGLLTGVLSGRSSAATLQRARELSMAIVRQEAGPKESVYDDIRRECGLGDEEIAYMGDDLQDLPVLERAGLAAAPADAAEEVRRSVHWVSRARGGEGAVRELIEMVLEARGLLCRTIAAGSGGNER